MFKGGSRTAAASKMEHFVHKAFHLGCCSSPRSASDLGKFTAFASPLFFSTFFVNSSWTNLSVASFEQKRSLLIENCSGSLNHLSGNFTKWSNTLKQFVDKLRVCLLFCGLGA